MDKSLLKLVLLISVFIGGLAGILTIVPYLGQVVFWILLCLAAVIVMRTKLLELFTVQESVTLGAIIGFVSFMTFCVVYVPAVIILLKFFNFSSNYGVSLILSSANFWIMLVLSVFMAILSAVINAFSGFMTFYVKEFLKTLDKNEEKRHNQFR